ncbi:hypothetical protein ACTXT7_010861 [Hymenolepis weldensis]
MLVPMKRGHFPKNPSLRDGISNFVDVRWSDFVHPPDVEIWNQHLSEEALKHTYFPPQH